MKLTTIVSSLFLLARPSIAVDRPKFSIYQSRVKQHRQKTATGDLVAGEEHLRKFILGWYSIPGAEAYEVCHQCVGRVDESTGGEIEGKEEVGTVHPSEITMTCGGQPCLIMPGVSMGYNHFHLRYQIGGEWSPWSDVRNYNVGKEIGTVDHDEL